MLGKNSGHMPPTVIHEAKGETNKEILKEITFLEMVIFYLNNIFL